LTPEGARMSKEIYRVAKDYRAKYPNETEFQLALVAWEKENPFPVGSVRTVVNHIEHIIKTAGIDHVGIGSDFDGITYTPKQLEDVSCYPYITQELLNRGYTKEQIHKVLGGNIMRVFRKAEDVAKGMK